MLLKRTRTVTQADIHADYKVIIIIMHPNLRQNFSDDFFCSFFKKVKICLLLIYHVVMWNTHN